MLLLLLLLTRDVERIQSIYGPGPVCYTDSGHTIADQGTIELMDASLKRLTVHLLCGRDSSSSSDDIVQSSALSLQ